MELHTPYKYFIILKNKEQFYLYNIGDINIGQIKGEINIENKNLETIQDKTFGKRAIMPEIKKTNLVYFSNIFDYSITSGSDMEYDFDGIYFDISSTATFINEYYTITNSEHNAQSDEILRQIRFINSLISKKINFIKPKFLIIKYTNASETSWKLVKKYSKEFEFRKINMMIYNMLDKMDMYVKNEMKIYEILKVIFVQLIDEYIQLYSEYENDERKIQDKLVTIISNLNNLNDKTLGLFTGNFIKTIRDDIVKEENIQKGDKYKRFIDMLLNTKKFINIVENNSKYFIDYDNDSNIYIRIEESEFINKLILVYNKFNFSRRILTFDLSDLSSGEKGLLTTYSRFYWLVDRRNNENDYREFQLSDCEYHKDYYVMKENVIILLDEGEVFLHPNWQREYLYNMISFLNYLFDDCDEVKNIQIILTSNSPFVISDLPKDNIIFFQRDNEKCCVKEREVLKYDTFASNIHTLLSDSFFMSKSLIGEFAKRKITSVINYINNLTDKTENNEKQKEEIEFVLEIIGEPIIKNKLNELYEKKRFTKDRIKRIEEEIKKLEDKKAIILKESGKDD